MSGLCNQPTPHGPCKRKRRRHTAGCGMPHDQMPAMATLGTMRDAHLAADNAAQSDPFAGPVVDVDPFKPAVAYGIVPVTDGAGYEANSTAFSRHVNAALNGEPAELPTLDELRPALDRVRADLLNDNPGLTSSATSRPVPVPMVANAIRSHLDGSVPQGDPGSYNWVQGSSDPADRLAGLDAFERDYPALRDKLINGSPAIQPPVTMQTAQAARAELDKITRVRSARGDEPPLTAEAISEAFPPGSNVKVWNDYRSRARDYAITGPAEHVAGQPYQGPHDTGSDSYIRVPVTTPDGKETSVSLSARAGMGSSVTVIESAHDEAAAARHQADIALAHLNEFHSGLIAAEQNSWAERGRPDITVDDEIASYSYYQPGAFIAAKAGMSTDAATALFTAALKEHPRFAERR